MNGRAKGKRGEREAVRLLRAEGLRAFGVRREAGELRDVDAVIFLGGGSALEVQIRRLAGPPPGSMIDAEVGPGRVLLTRADRGWWVVYTGAFRGPRRLEVFARELRAGERP